MPATLECPLSALGQETLALGPVRGEKFVVTVRGTFAATLTLYRRRPGEDAWQPWGTGSWTAAGVTTFDNYSSGLLWMVRCTAYTSGAAYVQLAGA